MKISSFTTAVFSCAVLFFSGAEALAEQEVIKLNESKNIRAVWGQKLQFSEDGFSVSGKTFLAGTKKFDIDLNKTYSFSATVVGNGQKKTQLFIGFELFDENGKSIPAHHLQGLHYTFTETTRDAKKGDKIIYVKNGMAWVRAATACVMTGAKADASDLPNKNIVASGVKAVKKIGSEWEITLHNPLMADLPAKTAVRQQCKGGFYYSIIIDVPESGEKELSFKVRGLPKYPGMYNRVNWPFGAKKAQFLILSDWRNTKTKVTFKNPVFTIE